VWWAFWSGGWRSRIKRSSAKQTRRVARRDAPALSGSGARGQNHSRHDGLDTGEARGRKPGYTGQSSGNPQRRDLMPCDDLPQAFHLTRKYDDIR
jgi:hypothetical protein